MFLLYELNSTKELNILFYVRVVHGTEEIQYVVIKWKI